MWYPAIYVDLNKAIFTASVESILLYGSEAWTPSTTQEARLDGCYANVLRMRDDLQFYEEG